MSRDGGANFRLEALDGEQSVALGAARPLVIGQDPTCDLSIAGDHAVSRFHCSVVLLAGGRTVLVTDLGSHGRSWINGQPIEREALLEPGDTLSVGSRSFRLVGREESLSTPSVGTAGSAAAIPPRPSWFRARPPAPDVAPAFETARPDGVVVQAIEAPPRGPVTVEPGPELASPPSPAVTPERRPAGPLTRATRRVRQAMRPRPPEPVNLAELVAMERRALPLVPATGEEEREEAPPANWALPLGSVSHPKAGRKWNAVRDALYWLSMALTASLLVVSAVVGVVLTRALIVLARTGLSVFIPFESGGPQFHDAELMQIGVAMGCVGGTPVLLFLMASKFAEEMTMLVLAGLGAGVALGFVFGSGAAADGLLAASALIAMASLSVASAVLAARCMVAPVAAAERLCSGISAMLLAGSGISLIFCLRAGVRSVPAFSIPTATPPLTPPLLLAIVCLVVAMPLFMLLLRRIALSYGDEPTRIAINEALVYHGLAWVPALAFACLINGGSATGWTSGIVGLLGMILLFAGYVLFVRTVRYGCYILG